MDLYKEISKVAYELYEKRGKAEGRDLDDWLEAERILRARYKEEENLKAESSSSLKKKKASTNKRSISKTLNKSKTTKYK
jgi:hypothetical protein